MRVIQIHRPRIKIYRKFRIFFPVLMVVVEVLHALCVFEVVYLEVIFQLKKNFVILLRISEFVGNWFIINAEFRSFRSCLYILLSLEFATFP